MKLPSTKPKGDDTIRVGVIGNRIVITSEDPTALSYASRIARALMADEGDGQVVTIPLRYASAQQAAQDRLFQSQFAFDP